MDQDKQETFDEMVGPVESTITRLLLLAARRADRTKNKLRVAARKRLPFILPARGPLSDLDGGIEIAAHVFNRDPLVLYMPVGGPRPLYPLAAIGRRLSDRFMPLASVPLQDPLAAARELERAAKLGLFGPYRRGKRHLVRPSKL